jgi:hypothetical protein
MSESQRKPESDRSTSRKTYKKPKLNSYGNIRDITRTFGNKGTSDGGPSGTMKKFTAL